jgi:hypothetical protein
MRIKQDIPTYNALIYLRTECSELKKRSGPNKKKIREIKHGAKFALKKIVIFFDKNKTRETH